MRGGKQWRAEHSSLLASKPGAGPVESKNTDDEPGVKETKLIHVAVHDGAITFLLEEGEPNIKEERGDTSGNQQEDKRVLPEDLGRRRRGGRASGKMEIFGVF